MLTRKMIVDRAWENFKAATTVARALAIATGVWDGDEDHWYQAQSVFVQGEITKEQDNLYTVGASGLDGLQQLMVSRTAIPYDVLLSQGKLPEATAPLSPIATIEADYSILTPDEFQSKYGITQSQYNLGELPVMPAIPGVCPAKI
jgi:hypothetical protein